MKPRSPNSDKMIILKKSTLLAEKIGRNKIDFPMIAKELKVSRTVIYTHFKDVEHLKKEILSHALDTDNIIILIEALIFENITHKELSKNARNEIIKFFTID